MVLNTDLSLVKKFEYDNIVAPRRIRVKYEVITNME